MHELECGSNHGRATPLAAAGAQPNHAPLPATVAGDDPDAFERGAVLLVGDADAGAPLERVVMTDDPVADFIPDEHSEVGRGQVAELPGGRWAWHRDGSDGATCTVHVDLRELGKALWEGRWEDRTALALLNQLGLLELRLPAAGPA